MTIGKGLISSVGAPNVTFDTLTGTGDSYSMTADDRILLLDGSGCTGTCYVYLPPVGEAQTDADYTIYMTDAPGADITVLPKDGASYPEIWGGTNTLIDADFDSQYEFMVFRTNGLWWYLVADDSGAHAT